MRATFTEPPAEYEATLKDKVMWVGEPGPITEAAGSDASGPPPCFTGATLQCGPFYTDWSAYDRVDVYHDAIMPGSTYQLDTILNAPECKVTEEYGYSEPVSVSTSTVWGDLCGSSPSSPPDGVVDFADISAVIAKFTNTPGSSIKSRADIAGNGPTDAAPNRKVDFFDVSFCVAMFQGDPPLYPGPNEIDCAPYAGDCYADIRVDSNNDGVIDGFDDADVPRRELGRR